jgi:hypothetical protein
MVLVSSLPSHTCAAVDSSRFARAFNQFEFLDITGISFPLITSFRKPPL